MKKEIALKKALELSFIALGWRIGGGKKSGQQGKKAQKKIEKKKVGIQGIKSEGMRQIALGGAPWKEGEKNQSL